MLTLYTTISTGMLFSFSTTHRMLNSKISMGNQMVTSEIRK